MFIRVHSISILNFGLYACLFQLSLNAAAQESAKPSASETVIFGRDIAPVLVANCIECHDDARKRGGLSMTTPEKLTSGGESGPVIQPTKPDESLLVRHIRGDEQPRMPNGRRPLAETTIETIAKWVATGAKLDEGQSATAMMTSLAWSPERMTRNRLSRMSETDRRSAEAAEIVRIMAGVRPNQITDDAKSVQSTDHFMIIGFADQTGSKRLLASLEKARSELIDLLKPPADHPLQSKGRILLLIFQKPAEFAEFQRQNGFESTEPATNTIGQLGRAWPILSIAVATESLDFQAGTATAPKKSRSKTTKTKATNQATPLLQSADAMAIEAYTMAAIETFPKAPAWLRFGMAIVKAREYDRDDQYYLHLKAQAAEFGPRKVSGDWDQRSVLFLKDQLPPQVTLPMAYSLIDWLKASQPRRFPEFIRELTAGEAVLDSVLTRYWNINRQIFLSNWTSAMLRSPSSTSKKGR